VVARVGFRSRGVLDCGVTHPEHRSQSPKPLREWGSRCCAHMTFVVRALDHRSFGRLEWCNVRMDDLVAWLRGLFHDFSVRAPFGIGWELDRAEPPLTATVTPADGWTALFRLTGDDVGERLNFADQLRVFLDTELDRPVPPCPNHLAGLVPVRVDDTVEWRCPEGDFRCRVGDYEEALWPPGLQEDPGNVAPMLAARFRRLDVRGIQSVAVELRGRRWVAVVELRPDGDETAVREAAAPVVVAAEPVDAMRTVRLERPATETEPAHRALTIAGTPMRLAMCGGRLGRAVVVGHYVPRRRRLCPIAPPASDRAARRCARTGRCRRTVRVRGGSRLLRRRVWRDGPRSR
jgi:hypothetical protein